MPTWIYERILTHWWLDTSPCLSNARNTSAIDGFLFCVIVLLIVSSCKSGWLNLTSPRWFRMWLATNHSIHDGYVLWIAFWWFFLAVSFLRMLAYLTSIRTIMVSFWNQLQTTANICTRPTHVKIWTHFLKTNSQPCQQEPFAHCGGVCTTIHYKN